MSKKIRTKCIWCQSEDLVPSIQHRNGVFFCNNCSKFAYKDDTEVVCNECGTSNIELLEKGKYQCLVNEYYDCGVFNLPELEVKRECRNCKNSHYNNNVYCEYECFASNLSFWELFELKVKKLKFKCPDCGGEKWKYSLRDNGQILCAYIDCVDGGGGVVYFQGKDFDLSDGEVKDVLDRSEKIEKPKFKCPKCSCTHWQYSEKPSKSDKIFCANDTCFPVINYDKEKYDLSEGYVTHAIEWTKKEPIEQVINEKKEDDNKKMTQKNSLEVKIDYINKRNDELNRKKTTILEEIRNKKVELLRYMSDAKIKGITVKCKVKGRFVNRKRTFYLGDEYYPGNYCYFWGKKLNEEEELKYGDKLYLEFKKEINEIATEEYYELQPPTEEEGIYCRECGCKVVGRN